MQEDAENGKINLIIVKDLSRFGRNYIQIVCPFWVLNTSDIYSHIIKEADERSAECVAEAIYRNKKA